MADIDLTEGLRLSNAASSGDFAVIATPHDESAEFGDHPAPCCWFGDDREPGANGRDLRVSVNGDDGSLRTSEGAMADGRCVAWLLTNREELLRLAKIGQQVDRLCGEGPGREGGER